ncbi:MAG: recombinase family protein, partial [Tenericutes bacterium]|nr:recombinase family protein [Mycoplasmatota bacterium]
MNAVEIIDFNKIEEQDRLKNVCAYARVSTKKELQETSLDLQVETYTKMIMENPEWNFVGVYSDVGKSGTDTKYREQFNQMIELAVAGGIDLIITKSISRFARNTIDCLNIIQELKRHNIEVWFEKENISSFDPKVELTITIYASVAEEESKINSENSLWGVKKRFEDGIVPMVTSRVLGYKRDKKGEIAIDEDEAKIVRKVFTLYSKGYSQGYIAEELNKEGYI